MPAFDHLAMHTRRLLLRPLWDDDAAALYALFSDPEVMRYWSTPPWTDVRQARALLQQDRRALPAGEHLRLGLERTADGELLGVCSVFNVNETCRRAEIGYALALDAWGQGYMHEALSALLDYAFHDLGLNRVEADLDPGNGASAGLLARLGFAREGYLRERWVVAGQVSDSALYGLLRREWDAGRGGAPGGGALLLRPLREADIPAVVELALADYDGVLAEYHSPEVLALLRAEVTADSLRDQLTWKQLLVAERDGRILASGALADFGTPEAPRHTVSHFYVHPDVHGRGVGGRLLAHLVRTARQAGVDALHVPSSRNAIGFYGHAGFTVDEDQPDTATEITWMTLAPLPGRPAAASSGAAPGR